MRFDWLLWISAGTQLLLVMLGALVSLQEEWAKKHKPPILAAFLLLGVVGIYAANQQSVKSSQDAADGRAELSASISKVESATAEATRLQTLNTDLQQRLLASNRTLTELSKETLAQTTGGDTYRTSFR